MPREITWDAELGQLVFSPLNEQAQLRAKPLVSLGRTPLAAGSAYRLGHWSRGEGRQAEVEVVFLLPEHAASFGVSVMADADLTRSGMFFYADYTPSTARPGAPHRMTVGSVNMSISSQYAQWMPNKLLACCGQYGIRNENSPDSCKLACSADDSCTAWTFQPISHAPDSLGPGRCSKLTSVRNTAHTMWTPPAVSEGATSGVLAPSTLLGGRTDTLRLSPRDRTLSLRIFVDHGITEAFWQRGRVVTTRRADTSAEAGVVVHASAAIVLERAAVWRVGDIWVSPEEVLRTPRRTRASGADQ